uniref:Uncharacterized protein n=1 Tax=Chromera velia CCMP2878 TaxID=1169474 RepID=A0A0G4FC03_9ALVE|mmetsp:Transcript_21616/g.42999  ORF Transcript_21616/g.42999 Transcript_21616/m.42999 type:complete len:224 (+) Transcript_21616:139-810(+)|eukprot:Cvel_16256.t1-p1 / transcript=Cvel_16256.t1 / gene=Cvel_16256 / organism=Chromera_velia_CCMP2878 / gene_product=hypothetical protein / transcript_product=hypothetical protein / location=Cvel_scaffold1244:14760-15428(-) / protein_length=223 / sequence_SO=supercontig / SO=protein_coding / is_pseudo=false
MREAVDLASLFRLMLAEWQRNDTKFHGLPSRVWNSADESLGVVNHLEISHLAKPSHATCVKNLSAFVDAGTAKGLGKKVLIPWYARMRLRFSCSSLCVAFAEEIVPELFKRGFKKGSLTPAKSGVNANSEPRESLDLDLADLEVLAVHFVPLTRHMIHMQGLPVVEAVETGPIQSVRVCPHNILVCRKTGVVLDPTGGQFAGSFGPRFFQSQEEFLGCLPPGR